MLQPTIERDTEKVHDDAAIGIWDKTRSELPRRWKVQPHDALKEGTTQRQRQHACCLAEVGHHAQGCSARDHGLQTTDARELVTAPDHGLQTQTINRRGIKRCVCWTGFETCFGLGPQHPVIIKMGVKLFWTWADLNCQSPFLGVLLFFTIHAITNLATGPKDAGCTHLQ